MPRLRPLLLPRAAAAGFFFAAFVAPPPASCSSRSTAPSRTLAICWDNVSRSISLPPSLERSQRSAPSARQTPPLPALSHWPSSRPTLWSSSCHRSFFCSAVALHQTKSLLLDCL